MGGLVFIAAAALCTIAGGWRSMLAGNLTHLYVLAFALVFGVIGFLDDFMKVKYKRNLGLTAIQSLLCSWRRRARIWRCCAGTGI